MRDIEWLRRKAERYELVADYVNDDTLKLYSPKFYFDSWLIKETEDEIELWHQSKACGIKNISYHLQKAVPKHKKIWVLQRIKSHNRYVAFNKNKVNIVDKLLSQAPVRISV